MSDATVEEVTPETAHPPAEHHHPSDWQYIKVALILGAITAVEVAIYYVSALKSVLVPILIVLSVAKFTIVAMQFMHLRFDSHLFRRFFVTGIVLAIFVYFIVLTTFHVWSR